MISIRHGEYQLYSLTNKVIVCEMLAKYKASFTDRVWRATRKGWKNYKSEPQNRNTGLKPLRTSLTIIVISVLLLIVAGIDNKVLADSLQDGASKQRIGNYDVEMITDPKSPVVGSSISILLRISGVNGDHLVDVPATIRIVKDGAEIQQTNPIIVPFGHYTHHFTFEQSGRYTVYVDINDYTYSGEILTFTFFINVAGTYDYLFVVAPVGVGIAVATIILLAFVKKKMTERRNKQQSKAKEAD
jgi:hypothetical protein